MPKYNFPEVDYRSKGKDIQLPSERKRDPRLPGKSDPMEGLRKAGEGLAVLREKFGKKPAGK